MSKETVFHEMTASKDEVESLHKTKFKVNKTKLKPEWKLACTILCTIALMLECTNVILSSRCNESNHSVQVQREDKTMTPRVMSTAANNETSLCTEIREFKLAKVQNTYHTCHVCGYAAHAADNSIAIINMTYIPHAYGWSFYILDVSYFILSYVPAIIMVSIILLFNICIDTI